MEVKQAFFILRHGSSKGLSAYLEAVKTIEDKCPPVVRCRDCKWYQEGTLLTENKFCFRLKHPGKDRRIGYNYAPDDFCSYGERWVDNAAD